MIPHSVRRGLPALAVLAAALVLGPTATAQEGGDRPAPPAYSLPAGFEADPLDARLGSAVDRAVADLVDPPSPERAQDAARLVAGVGSSALPRVVAALAEAPWGARVRLFTAIAEMDAPDATPLLVAAARDRAFGVREAAVAGLGKTGDSRGERALLGAVSADDEPVWRVRAAAGPAIRRGVLRGTVDRTSGAVALLALLDDPDHDVRLAGLTNLGLLAAPQALPRLLAMYEALQDGAPTTAGEEPDEETRPGTRRERKLVLDSLRGYRDAPDARLLAALREGFVSADPELAVEIGHTLFLLAGAAALDDEEVADAALRYLLEPAGSWRMREGLASLGRDAAPWLEQHIRSITHRIALGRSMGGDEQVETLVDLLVRADEERAVGVLRWFLTSDEAEALPLEPRRAALERASTSLATHLGPELRKLFRSPSGRDLRKQTLRAIVKSGGDDVSEFVQAGLAHEEKRVVLEALTLLGQRPQLAGGPKLRELAAGAEAGSVQRLALETLARKDRTAAVEVATEELANDDRAIRLEAIGILGEVEDAANFSLLLERFRSENSGEPAPAEPPPKEPAPSGDPPEGGEKKTPVTASDGSARVLRTRLELLRALRGAGGKQALPVLFEAAADPSSPSLRRRAVQELGGLVGPDDAARLLALEGEEPNGGVQAELRGTLAGLGASGDVRAFFNGLLDHNGTRMEALRTLERSEDPAAPEALERGLVADDWSHEEKEIALRILVRGGRLPPRDVLRGLVASHSLDLAAEAVNALAQHGTEALRTDVLAVLTEIEEPTKLGVVVQQLGRARISEATSGLRSVLERARPQAMAAFSRGPTVQLYGETAIALARCGGDTGTRVLIEHLLAPELVHAAARWSVLENGPFHPINSTTIVVVRFLVRALAQVDDPTLARLFEEELSRRAQDGGDLVLDEGYVDGVARYLRDPVAYGLPARRRPAAGLVLRRLVPRIPPRMTMLDADAWSDIASELTSQKRLAEARDAYAASVAIRDVEDATRSPETRLWEQGKLGVLRARALVAAGEREQGRAVLDALREPDPRSDELAFLKGVGLAKIGASGPEARADLLFALAQNPKDAPAAFYLGWVIEVMDGPDKALPHYEKAERLDRRAVENAGNQYKVSRKGRVHPWSYYPYYTARALARMGLTGDALDKLAVAVRLDDRDAPRARKDAVLKDIEDLDAMLRMVLDTLPN